MTEITRGGSQIFAVCLVGVWQHNYAAKHRPSTPQISVSHTASNFS